MILKLPEILDIPKKLLPLIFRFNDYRFFLIEGGRGGGKSQSVARFILYLCEKRQIFVCCGREIQATINESVYKILVDIIKLYNLNFTVKSTEIIHNITQSRIIFKGFREQGRVNIKGLEGVDLLWVDEAESITKSTLDIVIPTIRKNNSKIIFTMNRYIRSDPVFTNSVKDPDCLHLQINYYENPYCPEVLIHEAQKCKKNNLRDYNHIWLGQPLEQTNDYLFASSKLDIAYNLNPPNDNSKFKISCLSVDVAGSGGDLNVAKFITQKSSTVFEEEKTFSWSEADTDITIGKIISLNSTLKPSMIIIDADGVGYAIANSVKKSVENTIAFRGAGKVRNQNINALNARAEGYLLLRDFINNGFLHLKDQNTIRQLEYIKCAYKSNGLIMIEPKDNLRKENGESPDFADSLMMSIYALTFFSYMSNSSNNNTVILDTSYEPF